MFGDGKQKATGAEAMVAKLLGFTPDQMRETLEGFRDTIIRLNDTLARIEAKADQINARLEAMDNGGRDDRGGSGPVALIGGGAGNASGSDSGG